MLAHQDENRHVDRRYLEPAVLARIGSLELRARLIVEGFFSGMHHSPYRGASVEFADHRAYAQGDDLRHIDWKVFAKTDKYYIKEYEQETNLNLLIVLDASESMRYRSTAAALSKYDYGASVAAAIAYLALRQHDAVGLIRFGDGITDFIRPSSHAHQYKVLIQSMSAGPGRTKTALGGVLHELAERLPRRTLLILISDLFDHADAIVNGLQYLRYRHHELIVWCIWDRAEWTLPFAGRILFDGLESSGRVAADPKDLANRYRQEVRRFQGRLRAACGRMQVDLAFFDTSTALDAALSGYLASRSARLRQRSSRVMSRGVPSARAKGAR